MKVTDLIILGIALLLGSEPAFGQNNRHTTYHTIGWYNSFATIKLTPKLGIHAEYQWRRADLITSWQQSLSRVGVNFQLTPNVLCRVGYAWIETYPYGTIPINSLGRIFTEHRIFEMIQLSQKEGIVDISHRFILEQRFVGKYSNAVLKSEDQFPLLHRLRYMLRLQLPLKGKIMKDKTPYAAMYNEVFIGFGKNVNANVFDQNRTGAILGYRFTKNLRIEAGYLNQTLQLGREVNGMNVFHNSNGIIVNAYLNFGG